MFQVSNCRGDITASKVLDKRSELFIHFLSIIGDLLLMTS